MTQETESLFEDNPPVQQQGDFSQFYYALLEAQEEHGFSDLVIHVAYGIYKTEKQKEIERLRTELGRAPERKELSHFVNIAISHIDYYITSAGKEHAAFAKFIIDSLEEKEERRIVDVAKKIVPQKWYTCLGYGVLGNFIWMLLVILMSVGGVFGDKIQALVKNW